MLFCIFTELLIATPIQAKANQLQSTGSPLQSIPNPRQFRDESSPAKARRPRTRLFHVLADEGLKNKSFDSFRSELLEHLALHDKAYLENVLSADIGLSIGGERGKKAFLKKWQDLDDDSPLWQRLERVLMHGAQFDEESSEYHTPAISFEDSHAELPQGVVWNKVCPLRKAPDLTAKIIASPFNEQITILEPAQKVPVLVEWIKVKTATGVTGYMKAADVYSAYDEFAVFNFRQGKWCLTWFGFASLPF